MIQITSKSGGMTSRLLLGALLGSTALAGGFALEARAQPTDTPATTEAPAPTPESVAADPNEAETVYVTATRRARRVQDVPYNISTISGGAIDDAKMQDTAELLRAIPGISFVDRGARNASVVSGLRIRGLNMDSNALGDYAVSGVGPVSTYIGDTPVFANFVLRDLERVEVLRGPQGTLYGSGSLGGTVRFLPNKPQFDEMSGWIAAGGSYVNGSDSAGWNVDGMLNVPLGSQLAFRVTATYADYPGITDYRNVYVLDANGIPVAPGGVLASDAVYRNVKDADTLEYWHMRASLLWKPSENADVLFTYATQEDDVGGRRQQTPGRDGFGRPYQQYENGSIQLEPSTREIDMYAAEANIDFGFATLTSSTSLYEHSGDSTSENTGFYAQFGFLSYYYNYPRPMASAERSWADDAFVEEVRLVSNSDGPLQYVIGLFYQDQTLYSTQDSFLRGYKRWWDAAFPGFEIFVSGDQDFIYRRAEDFQQTAVFGELTWQVNDRFQITGGVRQFWNESDNHTFMDIPIYTFLSQPTNAVFNQDESDALFKVNASYDFAADSMIYATISEGYRRGGSNAVPLVGRYAESATWQLYGSDRAVNYEVGVKGVEDGVRYGVTAFLIDWEDIQLNTATPTWGFYVVMNGGKATTYGLEFELSGDLNENWTYGLGYTYINATLTEEVRSPVGTLFARDGDELPGTPEHAINGSLEYHTRWGESDFRARVDGYYQSSMRNAIGLSSLFNVPIDGFAIFNATVGWTCDDVDISLFVKNITNEEGVTGVFTEDYMGTAPAIGYFGNGAKELIALPRTFGISITKSF